MGIDLCAYFLAGLRGRYFFLPFLHYYPHYFPSHHILSTHQPHISLHPSLTVFLFSVSMLHLQFYISGYPPLFLPSFPLVISPITALFSP